MKEMEVKIPAVAQGSYRIFIGEDILGSIIAEIRKLLPGRKLFIVSDANVARAGHVEAVIGEEELPRYIIEPPGEVSKHLDTVGAMLEVMERQGLGRDTAIVAIGGGTVGDMAGFAASIFKRGAAVVHVPTTTVAQADSAIGGKCGVDSSIAKNSYGTFWQPAAVFIDTATLDTLDERQYRAGLVESVKHGLIADADYFASIEKNLKSILERKHDVLEELAVANCRIKASVVEADPFEKNLRRILNYGHTIGHAVESASDYRLLHGEAVAIGIVAAGIIEEKLGLARAGQGQRIHAVLERLGVPTAIPASIEKAAVEELLKHDKKTLAGKAQFVLLEKIGTVRRDGDNWAVGVDDTIIRAAIDELYA